ncbi:MAG: hypothetical protein DDT22_01360 [candidate division WS2 bacterium]|nr:hypothetical protein [Candidatus Lithacetigena glycinireducens]
MWIEHVRQFFRLSPLQLICLTAYGEARGEGREGMQAVINVIHNRRLHPIRRFGDLEILEETRSPYHAVILRRWQFSIFNLDDRNRGIMLRLADPRIFEGEARNNNFLKIAVELGELLRRGTLVDITGGADHYLRFDIRREWTRGMVFRGRIGDHVFWSEPPHYFQSPQVYHPEIDYVSPAPTPPDALPILGVGGLIIAGG